MELRQLRYAARVAQTRHFGRAAELEYIAPSVLSTQIRRLELEVGVELFERSSHRVEVTPAGVHFLREIDLIMDSLERLQSETRSIARSSHATLNVGYFGEALGELTPLVFDAFARAHSNTRLTFTELFMNSQFEALHSRHIDVAFIRLPIDDKTLKVAALYHEPVYATVSSRGVFARETRIHIDDIIDQPFAVAGGGTPSSWSGYWSLDERRGKRSDIGAEVTTVSEGLSAVAHADIVDTVPASAARIFRHPGVHFVPVDDATPTTMALVSHRDNDNPAIDSLLECVIELVRHRITLLPGAVPLV